MIYHSNNIIQDVKSKVDIEEVISTYTGEKIKRHFCKCPFHNEKTASLSISQSKQIFKCFGCGAGGDVINFVSKYYNINAREASIKINNDFNLNLVEKQVKNKEIFEIEQRKKVKREFKKWCEETTQALIDYHCYLYNLPFFNEERCENEVIIDYYCDVMMYGTEEDKIDFWKTHQHVINNIVRK